MIALWAVVFFSCRPLHRAFAQRKEKGLPAMINVHNLTIARKLTIAFGIICLLCTGLAGYTFFATRSVSSRAEDVTSNGIPSVVALDAMRTNADSIRRADLALALCPTQECIDHYREVRQQAIADLQAADKAYQPLISYPGERELYGKFSSAFAPYIETSDRAMSALNAGKRAEAAQLLIAPSEVNLASEALKAVGDDLQLNAQEAQKDASSMNSDSTRTMWMSPVATLLIVLLSALTGWQLTRLIAPRIAKGIEGLERMAQGDLTLNYDILGSDEIGRLGIALNRCAGETRKVIQSVESSASTLAAAVAEITAAATQSAQNTRNQSAKTSQIAAAAEELTVTIGEISRNSESAASSSRVSAETATQGGTVMRSAAQTMERIAAASSSVSEKMSSLALRSEEIGKVISVIQEISEQTNLLALNAAIESARAGEHGRGFAVVAGEVRRLAERTRSATEEIGGTIHSIQEETRQTLEVMRQSESAVQTGIAETTDARKNLDSIIDSSKQVEQQVQLIATAATEQTSAAGEISHSASEISLLAEQSTRGAEQAVEALNNLSSLAASLDTMVRKFRVDSGQQAGGALVVERPTAPAFASYAARS
jgi:methyl-accepting chemotaxis protein